MRGNQKGFMQTIKEAGQEKHFQAAQEAWDSGKLGYVHREQSVGSMVTGNTSESRLTDTLSGILAIGWRLQSHSTVMNTVGINNEQHWFVFVR